MLKKGLFSHQNAPLFHVFQKSFLIVIRTKFVDKLIFIVKNRLRLFVFICKDSDYFSRSKMTRTRISRFRGASISAYGTYPRNGDYHGWDALRGGLSKGS